MYFNNDDNRLYYDLDFLEVGNMYPPKGNAFRRKDYRYSRQQFELTPEDLLHKIFPTGLLRLNEYDEFINAQRLLAYPRLLTLKTVDMVVGQPPLISAQANDETTEVIKDIRISSNLNEAFKQALIDYSRFGVFLLRLFKDENGKAKITAWDPYEWTPVFYPDGTLRIHYNVISWRYNDALTVQIHDTSDGSYEERKYQMVGEQITRITFAKKYNTDSGRSLLFAVTNTPTTTNPFGNNDYVIINALLQKAIERLQAILRVLDEHADPSMTGPHTLLSRDENDELVFRTSKFYAIGNDEQKPEYLVWEANLDSSFKAFDELCKQIFVLSEMGEAFLGASGGTGNVVSGTAMRFKMISPLEKARRITNDLTRPIKEIISNLMYLEGHDIASKDINIAWRDSLPKDPREIAELAKLESGSIAIKPLVHAIMDNYDMDKNSADHYVEEIYAELEKKASLTGKSENYTDDINTEDGRSHNAGAMVDSRKKGSRMNPASSENRGDDQNAKLK